MANKISLIKLSDDKNLPKDLARSVNWNGYKVYVRYNLGYKDMIEFVNSVLSACYNKKEQIYVFENKHFAIRVNVIMRYTNIELPDDLDLQFKIVYDPDLYNIIFSVINQQQLQDIIDSIDMYFKQQ